MLTFNSTTLGKGAVSLGRAGASRLAARGAAGEACRTAAADAAAPAVMGTAEQLTGQLHHVLSKPIPDALRRHPTLAGIFRRSDPRFLARAKDLLSHFGYQTWHRNVDKEVVDWLVEHRNAAAEEFLDFLRSVYSRADLRARFPGYHGP